MLKISETEYREIEAAAKANKNKRVAKRLEVLELRHAMKSNAEIATVTGFNKLYVTTLIQTYKRQGLESFRALLADSGFCLCFRWKIVLFPRTESPLSTHF
ncbi:MAG: hypothetical protein IKO07_10910 [Clostridia bacterium]|nr:hypothetical protein [Clostridia bacterium]